MILPWHTCSAKFLYRFENFHPVFPFYQPEHLITAGIDKCFIGPDGYDRQPAALPLILELDLGDGYIEALPDSCFNAREYEPFFF
jgi:hypothetical protein